MTEFETGYQALGSYDDDHEAPPGDNMVHVVPDNGRARWNHIEDLDEFFTRVYQYHQRSGFLCMLVQDILHLVQFMFVVLFSAFLINCVDYDILFDNNPHNNTHKVTIGEAVYPISQCVDRFDGWLIGCLVVASLFWFFRFIKVIYNLFKYLEMRAFYNQALKISSAELINMTWHEVQHKLLDVQSEQQMCIHKQTLTELDIYHRILRFKNYTVAMLNKSLLPLKYRVPFLGDMVFLTTGLKYNLEMILFWGPWSPFENNWHLKPDFKNYHKRKELADYLSKRILWVAVGNLILSPLIFLWQILYSFFRYAEILKREPGSLGSRMWSLYSRLYLRHFNELDHEFNARLNRGYKPALRYMNIFTSPIMVIVAKQVAFFAGALLAVFVILTVVDEDVLAVQHVIAAMTILGIIVTIAGTLIPDEHMVWCPELLMRAILAQIHYIPDSWQGNAHTTRVRDEFSQLFQYKVVYLCEELLSPLLTPLVLFKVRHKSLEIVDFYRNFTVEVTGVGDVCSFAQMNIRRHGNPQWVPVQKTEAAESQQAEDGKTELSLMHFTITNPEWRPPADETAFLCHLKEQAHRDAAMMSVMPGDNPLLSSLHSLSSGGGYYGFNSMISSLVPAPNYNYPTPQPGGSLEGATGGLKLSGGSGLAQTPTLTGLSQAPTSPSSQSTTPTAPEFFSSQPSSLPPKVTSTSCRGGLRNAEGPLGGTTSGLLASLQATPSAAPYASLHSSHFDHQRAPRVDEEQLEMLSTEMSFSALYMHELHRRRMFQPLYDVVSTRQPHNEENLLTGPGSWTINAPGPSAGAPGPNVNLPHIQEDEDEVELINEGRPLLLQDTTQAPR